LSVPHARVEVARDQAGDRKMTKKANLESRETKRQKPQQKLDALIRDLERELAEGKNHVEALDETQKRLQETERICQELADENHRLGKEIASWQERFGKNEENQRQVSMLRQQLEALQAEHARVIETNRQMQEKLADNGDAARLSPAAKDGSAEANILRSEMSMVAGTASDSTGSDQAGGDFLGSSRRVLKNCVVKGTEASQIAWSLLVRNWRISSVCAGLLVLMFAGAIAMKSRRSEVSISRNPMEFTPEPTTVETVAEPVSEPPRKAAPRVLGAFQTVRPTQVFTGPSENSEFIVNLEKGVKVNVVNSRDGWLEIRSKHGRPPGFIRQDAAARIR
jgi:hypothetical protein